jgi:hypothetical protein
MRTLATWWCTFKEDDMADTVNPQITDAVTQSNVKVLGDAPAMAMGNLYQATAQALANAAHNATTAQQNANVVLQATTTQGVALLYSIDTAAAGKAVAAMQGGSTASTP